MQLKTRKTETIIGERQENKFRIGESAHGIIIDSLINLYENPIGSIVREITSNCVDAHRERDLKVAGKLTLEDNDNPAFFSERNSVEIEYSPGNELLNLQKLFVFKDWGVGLSEDRVKQIYTVFGNSTKRDSNDQIGGFGIGAKSPFSYTETFYIITRRNHIKYTYLLSRGNEFPTMDLVHEEETKDVNGTEIIIPLQKPSDEDLFLKEIHNQLAYFPNIYYANIDQIGNAYEPDIVEQSDTYLLDSNLTRPGILIDNIMYPLNTNLISGIPSDVGLVVKYKIGDLDLVPSRETIRYTEDTKEKLSKRFKKLYKIFLQDVKEDVVKEKDFLTFIIKTKYIYSSGYTYSSNNRMYRSITESSNESVKRFKLKCKVLRETGLKDEIKFVFDDKEKITEEKIKHLFLGITFLKIRSDSSNINGLSAKNYTFSEALNNFDKLYYVSDKTNKGIDTAILETSPTHSFVRFKVTNLIDKTLNTSKSWKEDYLNSGDIKTAQKNIDTLLPYFLASNNIINYDTITPKTGIPVNNGSTDWAAIRKQNEEFFYRYLRFTDSNTYGRADDTGWTNAETKVKTLEHKTDIIYGFSNDTEILELFKTIFSVTKSPNIETVWKIAKPLKKYFSNNTYVRDYFTPKNKLLRKQLTLYYIFDKLHTSDINFYRNFKSFNSKIYSRFKYFDNIFDNTKPRYFTSQIKTIEKLSNCKLEDFIIPEYVIQYQKLLNYAKGIKLLNYIGKFTEVHLPWRADEGKIKDGALFNHTVDFLKLKNKMKRKTKLSLKS